MYYEDSAWSLHVAGATGRFSQEPRCQAMGVVQPLLSEAQSEAQPGSQTFPPTRASSVILLSGPPPLKPDNNADHC